jgi:arylsulfatase
LSSSLLLRREQNRITERGAGGQLPVQQLWYKELMFFKEFPPTQAPKTWNLDGILKQVQAGDHPAD